MHDADAPNPADLDRKPRDRTKEPTDREKLQLVEQVLDLVPDFFYVHDEDMRFWYANRKAADYFGRSKDDLLGRRLEDVDPNKEQGRRFADLCRAIMQSGKPTLTDNIPYVRPDGTRGLLMQHDIPFISPTTGDRMLLGFSRDVTAEREIDAERRRAAHLENELRVARQIQEALTPREVTDAAGVEIAAFCEAAEYARGDFYDWGVTRSGRVALGLGDVTGHGVGPALLAASCRAYARVLIDVLPIHEALAELNQRMCREVVEGRFVTFAAADITPAGELSVLSAGQGPLMLVDVHRKVQQLGTHHPPLGVLREWDRVEPDRYAFRPGETFVMVSDGVFEAKNQAGEMFGPGRLADLLASVADAPSGTIVEAITSSVCDFTDNADLQDDVTVLVAKRKK